MKKILLFLLIVRTLFAQNTLVDALLDGNLTHKINATYDEGIEDANPYSASRTQTILFHYQSAPMGGLKLELATQSFNTQTAFSNNENAIYYTKALYEGYASSLNYKLSANYYADTYKETQKESEFSMVNAFGAKAEINYENFGSYVAYSKVSDGKRDANGNLDSKDMLLPTSSVLSSNNYAPNTQAYALDMNYALRKDVRLGSRYVFANDTQNTLSYTGIYSSFKLNEIAKNTHIDIAYDKTNIDKQENQFSINFMKKF
ncbi:hypothetical protein [Sulfurospirillum barnesii]|uniref:Uncharacterized protein n=1 Tax=Sulfurospirillum barnesii (strain ATCC 700032 / DSM 10660 / SES-3) TaxID=760154 RepID=I3XW09_SULBS|nr:hypothetical protein [Sulfurospirillum barnesii]AFL68133.1 hypothetical protein Sulba_0830 [Sulfurospirillum barnesii SES-3]